MPRYAQVTVDCYINTTTKSHASPRQRDGTLETRAAVADVTTAGSLPEATNANASPRRPRRSRLPTSTLIVSIYSASSSLSRLLSRPIHVA